MTDWQQIYDDEQKKAAEFIKANEELANAAMYSAAIGIMFSLNLFNDFDQKLSTVISNYYHISYSPDKDFTAEFINTGGISYGQKISILQRIMKKEQYKKDRKNPDKERSNILRPFKALGDIRNSIIHSSYRTDSSALDGEVSRFIIVADGRQISNKDFQETLDDFKRKYSQSLKSLTEFVKFLQEKEEITE